MSTEAERVAQIPDALIALNPKFADKIEGASEDQIDKLEKAAKRDFPEAYRALLRWGGKRFDADLWETDISVKALLKAHKHGGWLPPPPYLLIGLVKMDVDLDYDLYLDVTDPEAPGVARIQFSPNGSFEEVKGGMVNLGGPLSSVVFGKLFLHFHLDLMGATTFVGAHSLRQGVLAEAHRVLKRLGFERHRLSGADCAAYMRGDASAFVSQDPGQPATATLGAYNSATLRSVAGELEHELGMRLA